MRLVLISDTHNDHSHMHIPEGDVLIHAGDMTENGSLAEIAAFNQWLGTLLHKHKLVIAGNHDFCLQEKEHLARSLLTNTTYLEDDAIVIDGCTFYGSPWQPEYMEMAFNLPRGLALAEKWAKIFSCTDVLITHGPPHGILDFTFEDKEHVGCKALSDVVMQIKPKLHVFGHIHCQHGVHLQDGITFVNAISCGEHLIAIWPPVVFDL